MINFQNLRIRNKLRIVSVISIISLITLGIVSNYFYNTGKTLSIIINAERVHNNTFQEGIEDFYIYQITKDQNLLDQAVSKMTLANEMANNFATIDELLTLPEDEYINILFNNYKLAYNNDKSNAYLMASRVKLLLLLNPQKIKEAQEIAHQGYILGEQIKLQVLALGDGSFKSIDKNINQELSQMRVFYDDFATVISSLNKFANKLLFIGIFFIVIMLIITIVSVSVLISRSITVPIQEMVDKFSNMAKGKIDTDLSISTKNEIGKLADSFRNIQTGLREIIEYSKNVAEGNYSNQITPRSSEDEMSFSLNKMTAKLQESSTQTKQDSWFKSGINMLNEKLSENQDPKNISAQALSFMMSFLYAELGGIYSFNQDHKFLKLTSSSGFDPKKIKARIKLNEGFLGQVANTKELTCIDEIPEENYRSYSSSGEFKPKQIVITPLLFNDLLIGVIELASIKRFTALEINFIKHASEIIAINLNSSESAIKTNELLEKTQDQASELQVQQEELRVANEELVEQTNVLTENEKKLQVQQEELRVANEELEERTRQLEIQKDDISIKNKELTKTHSDLETKAKELGLASQYKSEFLANMSHELRTPLNSLLILSNMLSGNKKGNLTDDQVQSAKIIHKSGSDLLQLINEILDLSKIEAGKMSLELGKVKTHDLKEEVIMNFNATAKDKKLTFNVNIEDGFPQQIETDRYRLMQVVKNLLSNAFKFTSKGAVSVSFMQTPENTRFKKEGLRAQNTCCILVTDTGVGIPTEKLDAIFEAFQQADGSTSRKFGGTGLGLSISREIIRLLHGEIQLESRINEGSSFYIFLPIDTEQSKISPTSFPKAIQIEEQKSQVIDTKIIPIFIEDDRASTQENEAILVIHPSKIQARKYLKQIQRKNSKAIVASTIFDGIALAEKYNPKAIMIDAVFALRKDSNYQDLKKHKLTSKLPVHLISPIDQIESEQEGKLDSLKSIQFDDALNSLDSNHSSSVKKMLIIEDDFATRILIKKMLQGIDLEMHEAQTANEAFETLNNEQFDCIVLDLGLPDYSGKELLNKLRNHNIFVPKVIVYTGKDMSREEINELNQFTDTIILKGIKSDERLMDEVTLFLHQLSKISTKEKAKPEISNDIDLFKGKKIMVVDDDIRNVFALGQMLEERDIDVIEAENGKVAIELLQENQDIDLVLMDVMMPVMDGYEAMRIIRTTPAIKNIPIICLTAKAMKEDHENAIRNGANDYLAKPLKEDLLFSMIKIWLYKN